ncbi:MAG: hypothetical protein ACJ788_23985 [Ktedonobacteraceae bacterium]
MDIAGQVQMSAPSRQISEAEMRRYFTTKTPKGAIITAVVGALLLLIGLPSHSGGFIIVGLIVLLIGVGIIVATMSGSKPTDEEYDAWLKAQAEGVINRAARKLGLDPSQITREPLHIHGFVLPGMRESTKYRPDELHWKIGKDGVVRFSVNVYTYFFPADHHLAAFVGDVNALNQPAHNEKTEEYFYRDIVGATTNDEQDYIRFKDKQYQYRIQRFALRISSGDSIGVSVDATPIDNRRNMPSFAIPNSGIDQTVAQLRMLLREKKQSNM